MALMFASKKAAGEQVSPDSSKGSSKRQNKQKSSPHEKVHPISLVREMLMKAMRMARSEW